MLLPVLTSLAGLGATLVTLVLLALCAPNSSPASAQLLATLGWVAGIGGALGLGGAVYAGVTGRVGLAAWVGGGPVLVCVIVIAVLAKSGA